MIDTEETCKGDRGNHFFICILGCYIILFVGTCNLFYPISTTACLRLYFPAIFVAKSTIDSVYPRNLLKGIVGFCSMFTCFHLYSGGNKKKNVKSSLLFFGIMYCLYSLASEIPWIRMRSTKSHFLIDLNSPNLGVGRDFRGSLASPSTSNKGLSLLPSC